MQMYVLGQELGMKYLTAYGQRKFRKALATEAEGFWPCVEILGNIKDDEIADKVERRLRHGIDNRVWSTRRTFSDLEKMNPGMAMRVSGLAKSRFRQG